MTSAGPTERRRGRERYERFFAFGRDVIAPRRADHDARCAFDREGFAAAGREGLFRTLAPSRAGGDGAGDAGFAASILGLAAGSGDLGFSVSAVAHGVFVSALLEFGSSDQKARALDNVLDGTWLGAVANAEPGAGTDLMSLRSRVSATDAGMTLTSRKRSVTNVGAADLMMVSAHLEGAPAKEAVNIFLVDKTGERVHTRPITDLTGLRTSPTGDLLARRAPLHAHALLGAPGDGLRIFRHMFASERLHTGYLYLAALRRCLTRGVEHAQTRRQFGAPIGRNQYVQDRVVQMRVAHDVLEAHLERTLQKLCARESVSAELSVVKTYGIEAAIDAAHSLIRLLGSRGMRTSEGADKMLRDLIGLSILGGTVELQKMVIYNETVERHKRNQEARVNESDAGAGAEGEERIEILPVDDALDSNLEAAMVDLTARVFPGEAALEGRFFFDTVPAYVAVAHVGDALAAIRPVARRTIDLAGRPIQVAGGIIPAVDPAFRRRGIARRMVERLLERARADGDDLSLVFLFNRAPGEFLTPFGYRKVNATFTYEDRASGTLITEELPAYALALEGSALVEEIEAAGALHLGVGTW